MSDFILSMNEISKSYQTSGPEKLTVLSSIDLQIAAGDLVGLSAPSGAGKSTLLHICGLLDTCDKGRITFLGQDMQKASDITRTLIRRREIGFVYQFHHLLPEFSALENVCIPAFIKKTSKSEATKQALELLDYLGLANRAHHKPNMLSGGEQQRVAMARALINKPSVLLADEPSGNLDSKTAEQLHKLLLDVRDNFDQTIVLVTHNRELAAISDRTLRLVDGQWQ